MTLTICTIHKLLSEFSIKEGWDVAETQNVQGQMINIAELRYNVTKATEYFVLYKWVFL